MSHDSLLLDLRLNREATAKEQPDSSDDSSRDAQSGLHTRNPIARSAMTVELELAHVML